MIYPFVLIKFIESSQVEFFEKIYKLNSNNYTALFNIAKCYEKSGDLKNAAKFFKNVISFLESNPKITSKVESEIAKYSIDTEKAWFIFN